MLHGSASSIEPTTSSRTLSSAIRILPAHSRSIDIRLMIALRLDVVVSSAMNKPFNPETLHGITFYDNASKRYMRYIYPDADSWMAGWLVVKNPSGEWMTLRKATDTDLSANKQGSRGGASRMTETIHCPVCGYTKDDSAKWMDHERCKGRIPTTPESDSTSSTTHENPKSTKLTSCPTDLD